MNRSMNNAMTDDKEESITVTTDTDTTVQDAFEEAVGEKLLEQAQTEFDGDGFEKPEKTRRQLAEEFLEHFQADVESAEKSLVNARVKLRNAVEIRDDAEENLRRAIREENEVGLDPQVSDAVMDAARDMKRHAEEAGIGLSIQVGNDDPVVITEPPSVDPITGEVAPHTITVLYPHGESAETEVGQFTRYGELVADYGTSAGIEVTMGEYQVVDVDGHERDLGAGIAASDYGQVLIVLKAPASAESAA